MSKTMASVLKRGRFRLPDRLLALLGHGRAQAELCGVRPTRMPRRAATSRRGLRIIVHSA
jgi:hypothetical protein